MESNVEQVITYWICDGGVSKKRDPKFPAYGSFRSVTSTIKDGKEEIISLGDQVWISHKNNIKTNNQSEFAAMIYLLNYLKDNWKEKEVLIRADSEFVVKAMNDEVRVSSEGLPFLYKQAKSIMNSCDFKIQIIWITGKFVKLVLGH